MGDVELPGEAYGVSDVVVSDVVVSGVVVPGAVSGVVVGISAVVTETGG